MVILEYCSVENLIQREQYYIDTLNPEYNICSTAGSTLGKLHSEKAKDKIRNSKKGTFEGEANPFFGKSHTEESRQKMSVARVGGKIPISEETREKISLSMKGREFTEEHKAKLSAAKSNSKRLSVFDLETNIETIYASIAVAARCMDVPRASLQANLRSVNKNPYQERYVLKVLEK